MRMDLGINKPLIEKIASFPSETINKIKDILQKEEPLLHYLDINSNGYIAIDKTLESEDSIVLVQFLSDCGIHGVHKILDQADTLGVKTTLVDRSVVIYKFSKILALLDVLGLKATGKVVKFDSSTFKEGVVQAEDVQTMYERPAGFPPES